jgi:hypothetical protein
LNLYLLSKLHDDYGRINLTKHFGNFNFSIGSETSIQLNKIKFVGYAFQIEMKFTAIKHGFKVVEIPIIFTDRTEGTSKMSPRIFREAFLGVIQLKIGSWFRSYKKPSTNS